MVQKQECLSVVILCSSLAFSDNNQTMCAIMKSEMKCVFIVRWTCWTPVVLNKAMFDLHKHCCVWDYIKKQCKQAGSTLNFKHTATFELHWITVSLTGSYFYVTMKLQNMLYEESRTCWKLCPPFHNLSNLCIPKMPA